jgi:hypothetical protein
MRFRLFGMGYLLGWPHVARAEGTIEIAITCARQILTDHPDCEWVEVYDGEALLDVVTRGAQATIPCKAREAPGMV